MTDGGGSLGLLTKPSERDRVRQRAPVDDLDGDASSQIELQRLVHRPHAAAAKEPDDLVFARDDVSRTRETLEVMALRRRPGLHRHPKARRVSLAFTR